MTILFNVLPGDLIELRSHLKYCFFLVLEIPYNTPHTIGLLVQEGLRRPIKWAFRRDEAKTWLRDYSLYRDGQEINWYEETDMLGVIKPFLVDSLRHKKYRGNPNPLAGHCYVASEVLFHAYPGRFKPMFVRHEGEPHWYLKDKLSGEIVDPTVSQFKSPPDYSLGKGKGFLTSRPSKRAQIVLNQLGLDKQEPF